MSLERGCCVLGLFFAYFISSMTSIENYNPLPLIFGIGYIIIKYLDEILEELKEIRKK